MDDVQEVTASELLEKAPVLEGIQNFVEAQFEWINSNDVLLSDGEVAEFRGLTDPELVDDTLKFAELIDEVQEQLVDAAAGEEIKRQEAENRIYGYGRVFGQIDDSLPETPEIQYFYGEHDRESLRGLGYLLRNEVPANIRPAEDGDYPLMVRQTSGSVQTSFDDLYSIQQAAETLGDNHSGFSLKESKKNSANPRAENGDGGEIQELEEGETVQAVVQRFNGDTAVARYDDNMETVEVSGIDEPIQVGDKIDVRLTGYDDLRQYGEFVSGDTSTDVRWQVYPDSDVTVARSSGVDDEER